MEPDAEQAGSTPVSMLIIEAVAHETDSDPLALEPPLYDAVDTDALDRLTQTGSAETVTVEFEYSDHSITVRGDGTIDVDGTTYEQSPGVE